MEEPRGTDPRRIGPYDIIGVLGSGGMGRVYLGRTAAGGTAAVKVIHADLARDPEFRRRFRREVETTAAITGPHIAAVLDSDVDAEHPWLATEYVPGPSLTKAVTDSGPLPPRAAIAVGAGIAEALATLHAQGLVHRDVKPSNVLLAADGPRLIDFGIARGAADSRLTRTGVALGTPQFMAPEQIQGDPATGAPADVFALGGVLLYAMTGDYPFGEGSAVTLLYRIVHESPQLDRVPAETQPLLAACLDKDPAARPSARDVVAHLNRLLDPERTVEVAGHAARRGGADATTERVSVVGALVTQASASIPAPPLPLATAPKRWRKPAAIGAGVVTAVAALVVAIALAPDDGGAGPRAGGAGKAANQISDGVPTGIGAGSGVLLPNGSTSGPAGSLSPDPPGQSATTPGQPAGNAANGTTSGATTGPTAGTSKPGTTSASSVASAPKASGSAPTSHNSTAPPVSSAAPSSASTSSSGSASDPPPARVSADSGTHLLKSAYDSHCVAAGSKSYANGTCSGSAAQWKVWRGVPTQSGYLTWQFESTSSPGYCMSGASTALAPCSQGDPWQWWASSKQPDGRTMLEAWNDFHQCLINHSGAIAPDSCSSIGASPDRTDAMAWWTLS
ncbi:MAG: protein kinase [Catenulisporales bacterium]|nr:protein kinase [Catenulisporales bacterium]